MRVLNTLRNNLRPEHRLARILMGGIGEIFMVMVGILLALQVNNWNDERKRSQLEHKVLGELMQNLRMDSVDHAMNRESNRRIVKATGHIVDELEARRPWHDSMAVHYGLVHTHGLATLNTSAYDNLRSIGFNLIRRDSIRTALTAYHSLDVNRLLAIEREYGAESNVQQVLPVLMRHVRINAVWKNSVPTDHAALMDDTEFRNVMRWKGVAMGLMAKEYDHALHKTHALITMIEREIEERWP